MGSDIELSRDSREQGNSLRKKRDLSPVHMRKPALHKLQLTHTIFLFTSCTSLGIGMVLKAMVREMIISEMHKHRMVRW